MDIQLSAMTFAAVIFLGILVFLEVGNRVGSGKGDTDDIKGLGAIEGAVFGLMGLLIAFTFSGAASRFEDRRHLITEEANAIGTAWLRIDVLPKETQQPMRDLFIAYMDNRATVYRNNDNQEIKQKKLAETASLQSKIWTLAVESSQRPDARNQASMLLLPALNEMIDITTTREIATKNHPPAVIFLMLGLLTFVTAFLAGYGMGNSGHAIRLHKIMFALIIALTLYVTIDLEFPRKGFIRIDDADQVIMDLRNSVSITHAR